MNVSIRRISGFAVALSAGLLLSCGRSTTSNEKTAFTHIDSLTETYLILQDTLLNSWNKLVNDENEKIEALNAALSHLTSIVEPRDLVSSLDLQLLQLRQIRITQKTLYNPDVVDEFDFASNSLISEIISLAEANPTLKKNREFQSIIEKIKISEGRVTIYRSDYDRIAQEFNSFLESNKLVLKDIDQNCSLEKRPLFSLSSKNWA